MSGINTSGFNAILICPTTALGQQLREAVERRRIGRVTESLSSYPASDDCAALLRQSRPDVVFLDLAASSERALELVAEITAAWPGGVVVGLLPNQDAGILISAVRAGAAEFLTPPFDDEALNSVAKRAERQRAAAGPTPTVRGKVAGFVAVKAGQGVTTIASNAAASLAEGGDRRVLLVDFDTQGGTVSFSWRVTHSYSVLDALAHSDKLDESLWRALVATRNGVDILLGPETPDLPPLQPERFAQLVEYARSMYEMVLLDLPGAYGPAAKSTLHECDHVFLVCGPELPSLHLTRKLIAHLEQEGFSRDQFSIVVNRLSRRGELGRQDMERVFNFPISRVLPADDSTVHRALTAGKPIPSSTALGREIKQLGESLLDDDEKPEKKKAAAGLSLSALLSQ